jgi:hypothetical protein
MASPSPAVLAALLAHPGCAALDEPVAEYLAGALLDLCDDPESNSGEAQDLVLPFMEGVGVEDAAPGAGAQLLTALRLARDEAPPGPPPAAPQPAAAAPCIHDTAPDLPAEEEVQRWWEEATAALVPDPRELWGPDGGEELGEVEGDGGEGGWDDAGQEAWHAADGHVRSLCEAFPHVDEATVCATLLSLHGDVEAAEQALMHMPPPPQAPPPELNDSDAFPTLGGAPVPPPAVAHATAGPHFARVAAAGAVGPGVAPPKSGIARGARPALSFPTQPGGAGGAESTAVRWVDTGAAVSGLYTSLRSEALDHVRLRNACFEQATRAYIAGDGALAKKLAAQGRRHAQAMFAAHDSAAGAIYASRNADSDAAGGSQVPLIDLHGLHVAEALAMCRSAVQQLRMQRGTGAVAHILVGTGHHTHGAHARARVPAAVQALLRDQLHLRVRQRTPGLLEVVL